MKKEKKEVERKTSKLAIISFVLGIVSVILLIFFFPMIIPPSPIIPDFGLFSFLLSPFPALGAILLGGIGLWKIHKNSFLKGRCLCVIAIILGFITLLVVYSIISKAISIMSTGF